jgi:glyoxylase-like metal-dependent hydrolase (beta-lactamase superfamily II)/rhodanese-related sulfurtransferase
MATTYCSSGIVIFRQLVHEDLGCASYMVGDEHAGVAAVVDPRFEIDEYLRLARYLGVSIEHILETHTHADHVSGHGRLAAATGARIYVHRDAGVSYEHVPIDDGFELELGDVTVRAMHTPGHRPEHTAFVLIDHHRGEEPWAVLTGDSLFVNDVARPDLAIEAREGAEGIYRSLRERLLKLPDTCEVWPGHLGGSMCGGPGMDLKLCSTIGFERETNPTLSIERIDDFVEEATSKLGPQPPNFEAIVELNRGPLVGEVAEVLSLTPRQLEQKQAEGALLVDARTEHQFDDAHIPGAVSIPLLRAGFGSKLAWLARRDQEIVFVGRDDDGGRRAARLARAVGLSNLAGFLGGGHTSWLQEKREVEHIERLPLERLEVRMSEDGFQLLDVRERSEWEAGHIPGSISHPWHDIDGLPEGIDADRPVAAICGSGERAGVAASLLQHHGADLVIHVTDGGVPRWQRLGRALVNGS